MRRKAIIGSVLALLMLTSIYVVAQSNQGSRRIGSYHCSTCYLGHPQPDPTTRNTLIGIRDSFKLGKVSTEWITVGDVITVCNGSACVDYQVTVDGDGYLGINKTDQTQTPPPRGGGGGGGGSGGGRGGSAPISGGCHGNCGGGRVTTGPILPNVPKVAQ